MGMVDFEGQKIFSVSNLTFEQQALELFHYQRQCNPVYAEYLRLLGVNPAGVQHLLQIPFLPVSLFKTHPVFAGAATPGLVFESSGTTGTVPSRHYVRNEALYQTSFLKAFDLFYGQPQNWCVIGLLPSYLERSGSSLVYMVNELIEQCGHPLSGFYLNEYEQLYLFLQELEKDAQPTLLIGVSYALLDFAVQYPMQLQHTVVMETGGMKGRRKEMTRAQLHEHLKQKLGVAAVHSEYGMTELLSQAYSKGNGLFACPPWMRLLVRDEDDPLTTKTSGRGALNVIDLANMYSCPFIALEDAGRVYDNGTFEVLGRLDNSDVRGCGLMYEQ
jgi:phenylacetate-coenzyme A ligase PaaK-like adenylate-forming protein